MKYLLDTDIIIYFFKGNQDIAKKINSHGTHTIGISDISKAELLYGAYKSKKVNENLMVIKEFSTVMNFLPFNELAQDFYGKTKATLEKKGKRLDDIDIMIAATALVYKLTLVTNNIKHFERIENLKIENWLIPQTH